MTVMLLAISFGIMLAFTVFFKHFRGETDLTLPIISTPYLRMYRKKIVTIPSDNSLNKSEMKKRTAVVCIFFDG